MNSHALNLFSFAPRELSHSAYWAWVIASLNPNATADHAAVRPVANALFERIGIKMRPPLCVQTEYKPPNQAGRADIFVTDAENRQLLIENKVGARLTFEQLNRYCQADGIDARVVAFSIGFDRPTNLPCKVPVLMMDDLLGVENTARNCH